MLREDPEIPGVWRLGLDLSDGGAVGQALRAIGKADLMPDAWVNCAGGFQWSMLTDTTDEDFEMLVGSNLRATFYMLRELMRSMKDKGYGRVVLISSNGTLQPQPGLAAYSASKAGVNLLVRTAQEEVKDLDININALLPSIIDTPANREAMGEAEAGKWVSREELADMALSLVRPWGRSVRGALIPVVGRV